MIKIKILIILINIFILFHIDLKLIILIIWTITIKLPNKIINTSKDYLEIVNQQRYDNFNTECLVCPEKCRIFSQASYLIRFNNGSIRGRKWKKIVDYG